MVAYHRDWLEKGSLRRSFAFVKCTTVIDCSRLSADTTAHDTHHDGIIIVVGDSEVVYVVYASDCIKIGVNCGGECQCLGCG